MKLRAKVGLIFGLTWLLITSIIIAQSYYFTLKDYLAMEADDVQDLHIRSTRALQNKIEALSAFTSDWAHWNDTLNFMKKKYERYFNENLNPPTTFEAIKLNYILYFDDNKNFYEGRAYNLEDKKFYPFPQELIKTIASYPAFTEHEEIKKMAAGFMQYHDNLIMIASYPITNNELTTKPNGNILMGYDLNKKRVSALSNTLQVKIQYINPSRIQSDENLSAIYEQLHNQAYITKIHNESLMYIYSKIVDINQKPIGMFKLTMPRNTYLMGINSIRNFIIASTISGIIIFILIEILLQWAVLDRLLNFKKTLKTITLNSDFSQRIPVTGNDEIAELIRDSNTMLEVINISLVQSFCMIYDITDKNNELNHEITARKAAEKEINNLNTKMMVASRYAGMADIATSVLHNIGNALNSVNTSATWIEQKIHQSEIDDLVSLAELLEKNEGQLDDFFRKNPKGKQIPQFIIMLARKGQKNKEKLISEVTDLLKNIDHIKQVINAQQVFNQRIAINEHCKLPDLISDALLLCKSRLENHKIKLNLEYESIPAIVTDKIKLLQILVNLIQNAIDALLAVEQEDKILTIQIQALNNFPPASSQPEFGKRNGEQQCVIRIIDNGIGIPDEHLDKIFSYGFTSKKNGHGFGLHTSSLAAVELGGALNATSSGTNQGAIFTLVLPYKPNQVGEQDG